MSNVHSIAQSGFGEGTNELYDRARPSYPASALAHIHSLIPAAAHQRGLRIIEPGSGTGIFSRLLLAPPSLSPSDASADAYPQWNITRLAAVEPSSGMRAAWDAGIARLPPAALEGKEAVTVPGGFDDLSHAGVREGEADLVVIAQAFHWCPDHTAAFREFAKYLSPDGVLVFLWNLESAEKPFIKRARELFEPYDLGTPQYYRGLWRRCFDDPAYKELFQESAKEEETFGWERGITDQGVLDRILSKSYMTEAHLNGERRQEFIAKFKQLLADAEGEKEYIDKENGVYRFFYNTDVVSMRRK